MEEIDYFKGVTDQEFIDYYKVDLFSRMEITIYTYPHEFTEEDPRPWEHLNRCEAILYEYLYNTYENADFERRLEKKAGQSQKQETEVLENDAPQIEIELAPQQKAERYAHLQKLRNEIVAAKMQQLIPRLNVVTDDYLTKVKLKYEDL
ncbi:hypothetical protein [Flavobacterium sp. FlaQc-30]|uniref:hypothetical protein n=1 Tax=Flavobacterium sp. FlaQc-30 TaxID=3374179 RepID=UPI00375650AF